MEDLGEPKSFLGPTMERQKENRIMKIHQTKYIEQMLEKFRMTESKPQMTPMATKQVSNRENQQKNSESTKIKRKSKLKIIREKKVEGKISYREAIGSLLYLAGATRPDISYAVNFLARKQANPDEGDWKDVKRIFRYIRGTSEVALVYKGQSEKFETWTNISFRDCEDSTSTSGYILKLFGDTISWRTHKQSYVSLSTCQAEYLAMSEACQEVISTDKVSREI